MGTAMAEGLRHRRAAVLALALGLLAVPAPAAPTPAARQTLAPAPPPLSSFRDCAGCPEMVVLPPGRFLAGPRPAERNPDIGWTMEAPRTITIPRAFAIGRYEVTWGEYELCVKAGACDGFTWDRYQLKPENLMAPVYPRDHPMIRIRRSDMERYAAWLTRTTGRTYRLPSSMEWEYAARAGTTTIYPWGEEIEERAAYLPGIYAPWPDILYAGAWVFPVGRLKPNAWGLYDMIGNTAEVVGDCPARMGGDLLARFPADGTPLIEPGCVASPVRGGGLGPTPIGMSVAARANWLALQGFSQIGFRLAAELGPAS